MSVAEVPLRSLGAYSKPCPDVSIVVVTWNAKGLVADCLKSLGEMGGGLRRETIVVDNASSDGTPAMVHDQFPYVRLLESEHNLGFSKANNIGIEASRGKYLCLVNSDVTVPPECIPLLFEFMEANPDVGMAGPQLLDTDRRPGRSTMRFPTLWNTFCRALSLDSLFRDLPCFRSFLDTETGHDRPRDVEVLNGWFWILRRSALEQVGLLDEGFFMYGDDVDWSYRFHRAGWRVVLYPAARAVHYGGGSSAKDPVRFHVAMHKASLQFWAKHHGRASRLGYRATLCLHEAVRVLGYGAAWALSSSSRKVKTAKVRRSWASLTWLMGTRGHS
jgi:GT2 family glycosyltransferase